MVQFVAKTVYFFSVIVLELTWQLMIFYGARVIFFIKKVNTVIWNAFYCVRHRGGFYICCRAETINEQMSVSVLCEIGSKGKDCLWGTIQLATSKRKV